MDTQGAAQERSKEELRKAGQEYLDRVLEDASKGKDPFIPNYPAGKGADPDPMEDPSIVAIEQALQESLVYGMGFVAFVAQAFFWPCLKSALDTLPAPALLVFLHFLLLAGLVQALAQNKILEQQPITKATLRGAAIPSALFGLQATALFGALCYGTVAQVVGWTYGIPVILNTYWRAGEEQDVRRKVNLFAGVAAFGVVFEVVFGTRPTVYSWCCLLVWAVLEAAEQIWKQLSLAPHNLPNVFGGNAQLQQALREMLEAQWQVQPATLGLLQHTLPALPVLVLGFILQEGPEIVTHEPSVPSIILLFVSCSAYAAWQGSVLFLKETTTATQQGLVNTAGAGISLILVQIMSQQWRASLLAFIGAVTAIGAFAASGFIVPSSQQEASPLLKI